MKTRSICAALILLLGVGVYVIRFDIQNNWHYLFDGKPDVVLNLDKLTEQSSEAELRASSSNLTLTCKDARSALTGDSIRSCSAPVHSVDGKAALVLDISFWSGRLGKVTVAQPGWALGSTLTALKTQLGTPSRDTDVHAGDMRFHTWTWSRPDGSVLRLSVRHAWNPLGVGVIEWERASSCRYVAC